MDELEIDGCIDPRRSPSRGSPQTPTDGSHDELSAELARTVSDSTNHGADIELALELDWDDDEEPPSSEPPPSEPSPSEPSSSEPSSSEPPPPPLPPQPPPVEAEPSSVASVAPGSEGSDVTVDIAAEIGIDDTHHGAGSLRPRAATDARAHDVPASPSSRVEGSRGNAPAASNLREPRFSGSSLDLGRLSLDDEPTQPRKPHRTPSDALPPLVDTATLIVSISAGVMLVLAVLVALLGDRIP